MIMKKKRIIKIRCDIRKKKKTNFKKTRCYNKAKEKKL